MTLSFERQFHLSSNGSTVGHGLFTENESFRSIIVVNGWGGIKIRALFNRDFCQLSR